MGRRFAGTSGCHTPIVDYNVHVHSDYYIFTFTFSYFVLYLFYFVSYPFVKALAGRFATIARFKPAAWFKRCSPS